MYAVCNFSFQNDAYFPFCMKLIPIHVSYNQMKDFIQSKYIEGNIDWQWKMEKGRKAI